MDQIWQAIVGVLLWGLGVFGKPLVMGAAATLVSWGLCERLTPPKSSKTFNRYFTLGAGIVMTMLVHLGIPGASLGVGWQGAATAFVTGLMGGGFAPAFHDHIITPYIPALKRKVGDG